MTSSKNGLKMVMIDLSGTLHIDDESTLGAKEALRRLRETRVKVKFVTNTTKESRHVLWERLKRIGFEISEDEIFSSLSAARDFIKKNSLKPMLLVDDLALPDFADVAKFEGEPTAVVLGLAPKKFDRANLNLAFRAVLGGAELVAINESRYYMRSDGLALGTGPFVKTLEYATGTKAHVVGKPSKDFFKGALGDVPPESAVMIGDGVMEDVKGAQDLGMKAYLVKTGKYRQGDESKLSPPPFKTVENFAAAVDDVISNFEIV